jgi:ATP-dependent Clp protease ATP-binding subunit ClpC
MIQVLMRRTRKNPVLVGEGGVGKTAIVYGLARRIADGQVPAFLADRQVLDIDASVLLTPGREDFESHADAILFVDGLFDLAAAGGGWPVLEATRVLGPLLARSGFQCIATGTPSAFRQTAQKAVSLALHFEIVPVLPPSKEDALRILRGVKQGHHHVMISDGAIEAAVRASARFLRHRCLPDRAIDLLDDASARVSLGQPLVRADNTVSGRDIAEAAAARAGAPLDAVERAIAETVPEDPDRIARELIALIPQGREWLEPLADYLAGCSAGEAEELAAAIRNAKGSPSH